MKKRIVLNLLKYGLALGVMAYVVWSNWGDPRGTAGKITVGDTEAKGKIGGTVLDYAPDNFILIEEPSGQQTELALKPKGKTQIAQTDGQPWPEGQALKGQTVSASEISRGLAYVWQRHAVGGVPVHWGYFALAGGIGSIAMLITFLRWYFLVRAVELPFRLADAVRFGFIGLFFNTFLPGSVGGDAIKVWFLAREQSRRTVAVATVIMDRVIALWALVWFVALLGAAFWSFGLLVGEGSEPCRKIVTIAWIIIGISLAVWVLLGLLPDSRAQRFAERLERLSRVGGAAAEFWRAVWMYRCRSGSVYGALVLSWVGHVGFVFLFYFSMRTLWDPASGQEVPTLMQHFLIVPIGLVIQAMPLFPGGAGIGELGFGLLYDWLGKTEASGVLGSLVQRVINWGLGLVGYIIYRRMKAALPSEADKSAPPSAELAAAKA